MFVLLRWYESRHASHADMSHVSSVTQQGAVVPDTECRSISATQQLLLAAWKGDAVQVREAIELGASLQLGYFKEGRAPHAAAKHGQVDELQQLLKGKTYLTATHYEGFAALHWAAHQGHLKVAAALLEAGAPCDAMTPAGWTPLLLATYWGHTAVVQLLLEAGASQAAAACSRSACPLRSGDISERGAAAARHKQWLYGGFDAPEDCALRSGCTPLHFSCQEGHLGVTQVLLGAQPPADVNAQDISGVTPLHQACRHGSTHLVQLLLGSGARWDLPDKQGWLPLHVASLCNHPHVIQLLLDKSTAPAHVEAVVRNRSTPLGVACKAGHGEVVSLLLEAGANMYAQQCPMYPLFDTVVTPIHSAVWSGDVGVLRQLLAAGADLGSLGDRCGLLLYLAAHKGCLAVLQELLAAMAAGPGLGAVNAVANGVTAVQEALLRGKWSCAEALIAAGADVNRVAVRAIVDGQDWLACEWTLLQWAVSEGMYWAVPLLATPSNLRLREPAWGVTPLELALRMHLVGVAQALVAAGSPAGLGDPWRNTALWLAASSSEPAVQALLPAMLRSECELCKRLQQGQQQQRQNGGGEGQQQEAKQQDPAAVLEAVAGGLFRVLDPSGAASDAAIANGVASFRVVLEVLGVPAASSCLQQILQHCVFPNQNIRTMRHILALLRVLYGGWLEGLEPLLQARLEVVGPLQAAMTQAAALQQQQQQQQECGQGSLTSAAAAAAGAGQWALFVQHLEQLIDLQPARACELLLEKAVAQGHGWSPGLGGLCEEHYDYRKAR